MNHRWLIAAVVAGVAIGVLIGRMHSDPAPSAAETPAPAGESRPQASGDPVVVFGTPSGTKGAAPPPRPADAMQANAGIPPSASNAGGGVDPAVTQPIDVGPVFGQQFAAADKQGLKDAMVDAHRELEREARDDSWSYPLEAEIDNSLVADTSMGNFRKEHVECRTTRCEIRLSASGAAQMEALKQWTSDIQKYPWASRLVLSSSSTISSDDKMDSLLIVSKPPEQPEPDQR